MKELIDTHHHLWDPATADYPWMTDDLDAIRRRFDTSDLAAATGPAGVTGTVIVQARTSLDESFELLSMAHDTPLIRGVVAWIDLTSGDVEDQINRMKSWKGGDKLVGCRHPVHDEEDENWLVREDVTQGLATLHAHDLAYDLLLRPRELPAAISAVRKLPDMRWVVDHIAKPEIANGKWEPWAGLVRELAEASTTCWVKLSGMVTEADWENWTAADLKPYVRHILTVFGPDRCMLGSDWPVCLLAAPYKKVVETGLDLIAHLPQDRQDAIAAENAKTAYRL